MLDVIKSYLVSLGFQVDTNTFNQSQKAMKDMDKVVAGFSSNTVKNFTVAGAAVTSFFIAAEVGIAKYMVGLAKADLQNEMFARRLWMNKDSAVAYKNSLSSLGAELQDLYLSPELLDRFNQLRQQATELAPPEEYDAQMKQIRDVVFEFQRMKLEMTYSMQWIGYYLFKYLEKPINNIKDAMDKMNNKISKDMPHWTKEVAQVLSWIVRLGESGGWAVGKIIDMLDQLSPKTKVAGSAFLGFFALLKMGPIGWLIAGITALLLLLDDFKTYQEGGDSLFGEQWEKLEGFKKDLQDDGTFKSFRDSLDSISTSLGNILGNMGDISDKIAQNLGFDDFQSMLESGALSTIEMLKISLEGIAGALETIDGILSGDTDKMKSGIENLGKSTNTILLGKKIGGYLNGAAEKGGSGDVAGALKDYANVANALVGPSSLEKLISFLIGEDAANNLIYDVSDSTKGIWDYFSQNMISSANQFSGFFEKHADGGIQTRPHLGWVAENYPEAIIPLDPNKRQNAFKLLSQTAGIMGAPLSGATNNTVNNINVTNSPQYKIYGSEPNATAREISRTNDYGLLTRNFMGVLN